LGKEREEEHGEEFVTTTHMFSDKVLPIANKAVTNTDAGRGECDVENFDMIVQDLNTIAEYFTPKDTIEYARYYLTFQLILQIKRL
jgi:hypothetical protein